MPNHDSHSFFFPISKGVPSEYITRAMEFISTMDSEIERITKLSLEAEKDMQHETIPDEIIGKIRYMRKMRNACMLEILLKRKTKKDGKKERLKER